MTVLAAELKVYKSTVITNDGTNGARMSSTEVVSGVANNVFPNVFTADRVAGLTTHRKTFCKVGNDADETLYYPQIWLDILTAGDDWVIFFVGTQRDVQSGIAGTEDKYGCADLYANVSAGAATFDVDVENAALVSGNDLIFRVGDKFRITNKATIDAGTGTEEIHTLTGVTPVSGTRITLAFSATTLANSYTTAEGTRVMGVYEPSDIECSFDNFVDTTAGDGTYDDTTYPVLLDNIGTVEETWTITFTNATDFGCVGDTVGAVSGGSTAGNFAPSNAAFSKPYFTLDNGGFAGTWASGDTIVFQSHPAAVPIWQKRVVPAACGSLSGNKTTLVMGGES
jgi:hypothetical protein